MTISSLALEMQCLWLLFYCLTWCLCRALQLTAATWKHQSAQQRGGSSWWTNQRGKLLKSTVIGKQFQKTEITGEIILREQCMLPFIQNLKRVKTNWQQKSGKWVLLVGGKWKWQEGAFGTRFYVLWIYSLPETPAWHS